MGLEVWLQYRGQVIRNGCIALGLENSACPAVVKQGWGGPSAFLDHARKRMTRLPCGGNGDGAEHVNLGDC